MATLDDINNIAYSGLNAIDALLDSGPDWNFLTPQRTVLNFTFDIAGADQRGVNSLASFNAEQKEAAYSAIHYIASITGIKFVEQVSGEAADMHFAAGDISSSGVTGLCAYEQSWSWETTGGTLTSFDADAYVYLDVADFETINNDPQPGSTGYQVLLHELGHALGLKHPFAGPYTLPATTDTTDYTVMSYTWAGAAKSLYQEYDLLALEWIYGGDGLGGISGNNGNDSVVLGTSGNDTLTGTNASDTCYGFSGNDTLNGGTGIDTLIGGLGDDTYHVDIIGDVTAEAPDSGVDRVISSLTWTLGGNIEFLLMSGIAVINGTGNDLGNTLTGNGAANILNGLAGNDTLYGLEDNDTLYGGAGIDIMDGGAGNDTYFVDNAGDITTETSTLATEIDSVFSSINRTLGANLENLTLTGTTAINGTGNNLANTLRGNSAANILRGGTGADTLIGGLGNDTYYVDNAGDITIETSTLATEVDTVFSSITRTLGANLENLTLTGTAAINGTGNNLANTLRGNSAANILRGGTGADTLIGWLGNDTYYVDNAGDITTETSTLATEIDTVFSSVNRTLGANLENLTLTGTAAINGTGNTLNNTLTGNSGANILSGLAGNDTLNGGAGKDFFVFNTALNATNIDSIVDFNAPDDTIRLSRTIFNKIINTGTLNTGRFLASADGSAADADDYILYNTTSGALLYDADGNKSGAAVQFATLDTKPTITAADFVVVA